MEEGPNGRAIASGIRLGELDARELCDLVFFWLVDGKEEAQAAKDRSMFEVPPKGYRGSLKGTGWDQDEMNKPYIQGAAVTAGEVKSNGHPGTRQPGRHG